MKISLARCLTITATGAVLFLSSSIFSGTIPLDPDTFLTMLEKWVPEDATTEAAYKKMTEIVLISRRSTITFDEEAPPRVHGTSPARLRQRDGTRPCNGGSGVGRHPCPDPGRRHLRFPGGRRVRDESFAETALAVYARNHSNWDSDLERRPR